jgi:hypothetical protein
MIFFNGRFQAPVICLDNYACISFVRIFLFLYG